MPLEWAAHEFRSSSGSIIPGPANFGEGGFGVDGHAHEG